MKHVFTLIIGFFILSFFANSQNFFHKEIKVSAPETATCIKQTADGGYVFCGYFRNLSNFSDDAILVKTNNLGDTIWTFRYGGTLKDQALSLAIVSDGYVVTGIKDGGTVSKMLILKVDLNGHLQWDKSIDINSVGYSIANTQDGGFIVSGSFYNPVGNNDLILVKLTMNCDTLWKKTFGSNGNEIGYSVIQTSGNEFVIAGTTSSYGSGMEDVYLLKTDNAGNFQWQKAFGGILEDIGYSVKETGQGGYLIAGTTKGTANGYDAYIIKTNGLGNQIWAKKIGTTTNEYARAVSLLAGDKAIVAGYSNSVSAYDFYLIKMDSSGSVIWERNYYTAGSTDEYAYSMAYTSDEGFIMAGSKSPMLATGAFYLIKTDSSGCSVKKPQIDFSGYTSTKPFSFCEGDNTFLGVTAIYDSYLWSNSETTRNITLPDVSGTYHVMVTDKYGCSDVSNDINITRYPKPDFSITPSGLVNYCPGSFDSLVIVAPGRYSSYMWNNKPQLKDSFIVAKSVGLYNVLVTDSANCKDTASLPVKIQYYKPYGGQEICIVTVDTQTNRNLIAWERVKGYRTAYYNIYKETTQAGVYKKIGSVPFSKTSVFVDNTSNPNVKSERYKISVVDSCETESELSPHHRTLHLTANSGAGGEINLIWVDHYQGFPFQTYYIYRGTSPGKLSLLDSIQSNLLSYTDNNHPAGLLFYQVSAKRMDLCYPSNIRGVTTSGPFSQSLSNLKDYSTTTNDYISVSPNSLTLYKEEDTGVIGVFSNKSNWTSISDQTWISLDEDHSNNLITVSVSPNSSDDWRSGYVTVEMPGLESKIISIWQHGLKTSIRENRKPDYGLYIFPNPFNSSFNFTYELIEKAEVVIEIYNSLGQKVKTITNEIQLPGDYQYIVDGFDTKSNGSVYFLRLMVNDKVVTRSLINF